MKRRESFLAKIAAGMFLTFLVFLCLSAPANAATFNMNTPIDEVIAKLHDPGISPKDKANIVKHLGKYFPISQKGKDKWGVSPLKDALKVIPVLIPLLNEDDPKLLFNTVESLAHIVQNYPSETYNQVRPHIEKLTTTHYPKVAKKVRTALKNMEVAYKVGR